MSRSQSRAAPRIESHRRQLKCAEVTADTEWLQVLCRLFHQHLSGQLYIPWEELALTSEAWRAEGLFEQCFFQRKPPGLRVRFFGKAICERLGEVLLPWLEQQVEKDRLRSFRFAAYEPEEFRFGGSAGMSVAHDLFDRDTRRVLQYEILAARQSIHIGRDLFSLAMSNDLLARCVEDGAEVWDIWRRLQTALDDGTPVSLSAKEIAQYCEAAQLAPAFCADCTDQEKLLLESAVEDNRQIATRLRTVQYTNGLLVKPRSWLAAACLFNWNRLGLTQPILHRMAAAMAHCWNPDPCR